jgi:hypothetical protein
MDSYSQVKYPHDSAFVSTIPETVKKKEKYGCGVQAAFIQYVSPLTA